MKTLPTILVLVVFLASVSAMAAAELQVNAPIPAFSGHQRDYAATGKGGVAKENFQAEVTVTIRSGAGGNGCAFLGVGSGKPNPAAYGEPTTAPSLVFRMAPNDFAGGRLTVSVDGQQVQESQLGDGTHRLRLSWDAAKKHAWLEIHRDWKAGATFRPTTALLVPAVSAAFGEGDRIFVGGAEGVQFADFSVKPLSPEELAKLPMTDAFPSDTSARTWLPVERASTQAQADAAVAPVDGFLKDLNATFRPVVCWYKGPTLLASRATSGGKVVLPNSKWVSSVEAKTVEGDRDALDLKMAITLKDGGASSAGIAAAFDFAEWNTENYVLIPASVYNGNRNRIVARGYAQGLDAQDYYRKDLPLTHGSVPCLAQEAGKPSKLEVNSSNATTPAVCIFDKKAKRGFILLAEQAGRDAGGDFLRKANGEIMDNAFAIEESGDRSRATVVVAAPGVRERKPEFIGFSGSPDHGITMKAGDSIELRLRLYSFAAADIPALFEKFMAVRKSLTGPNHPRNVMPASEEGRWLVGFTDGRFLSTPQAKFYMPENGDWIAFGWIGGWMNTFPMLAQGDAQRLQRVGDTFDFGMQAQEPSGYFHYAIRQDGNVAFREPKPDMNLARTQGDILFWMVKQFQLLKAQGRGSAIKPTWEASIKKLADALVTTWRKDGQWGKMINVKTGEVSEYNSSGGVMCIAGLALASDYFKNPQYLAVAREAADFYYQRDFVKQGQITGACADILQNADSETAFGFTTALMALYDVTGDKAWLEKSRNLANLAASWTVSYDYELPKFTALGARGTKLAGAVWASTQNKHAAPGICCSSGDPLFKIYRATGDARYAELMRDIVHAHADAIHGGGGSERLTYCDADSRGDNPPGCNGWVATNGAMMTLEVPGIYLRTDMDRFYVFDSVEAKMLGRDVTGVKVQIYNPTKFDAKVSMFVEDSEQAQKPEGYTAFLRWPKIEVKAGATVTVLATSNGIVKPNP